MDDEKTRPAKAQHQHGSSSGSIKNNASAPVREVHCRREAFGDARDEFVSAHLRGHPRVVQVRVEHDLAVSEDVNAVNARVAAGAKDVRVLSDESLGEPACAVAVREGRHERRMSV